MSDLARLLQQYGYGDRPNALAEDAPAYDTSNVLAGMPRQGALADALKTAGVPDEHGFLFSRVGGELKFNPFESIKNFMAYRAPPGALSTSGDDAPIRNAADAAGWVGLSGLGLNAFGAVPANALGSAGARLGASLPMDAASRMKRAAEQGYTVDAYHGTAAKPFSAFDTSDNRVAYLSSNANVANSFAKKSENVDVTTSVPDTDASILKRIFGYITGNPPTKEYSFKAWRDTPDGGYVIPTKVNTEGFKEIDWPSYWKENGYSGSNAERLGVPANEWDWLAGDIVAQAEKDGLPGVIFRNVAENGRPHTEYAVIDPTRIRSRYAAFDPAQRSSANLLASSAAASPIVAAALQSALRDREGG